MGKRARLVSLFASVSLVLCYVAFTALALSRFPPPYSPLDNWLSDLGNPDANPDGAALYNTGIVLAGVLTLVLFLSLLRLRLERNRAQAAMAVLMGAFGAIGSLAMILSAVYPINHPAQHSFWSMMLYFCIGTGMAFSVAALAYYPTYPKSLLGFGAAVVLVNMIVQVFFHDIPLSEWFNVPLLLVYCLLLGIGTQRLSPGNRTLSATGSVEPI